MPPLTALRAFEAAGRLGGFAPAAQELGVTPGAVTAHLKTLESLLGAALFERHHKGVTLTELGARVLPDFTAAFGALTAAVRQLETEAAPDIVRIATTPDLALLWLSPRLPALRAQGVRIVPVMAPNAMAVAGRADLGVFVETVAEGDGNPLVAVAAPGFVPSGASPRGIRADQCLRLTGAMSAEDDWAAWLSAAGFGLEPGGAVHEQTALALEEAAHGAGILVILLPLAEGALKAGRLVEPFAIRAPGLRALRVRALADLSGHPRAQAVLRALSADHRAIR